MSRIYVLGIAMVVAIQLRMQEARKDERGLGTLEMVVIGLGLFLAATAAVLVFTGAINTRLDQIK